MIWLAGGVATWLAGGIASWLVWRRHSYGVGLRHLPDALAWGPVPIILAGVVHCGLWVVSAHYRAWCREWRRGR